jgi:Mce-associated membrane protein
VEDQPTQSGDLTPAEGDIPQGKTARRRHRLPRQVVAKVSAPQEGTEVFGTSADTDTDADAAAEQDERPDEESTATDSAEPIEPPVLADHRPVGRTWIAAGIVAGALFVGAAAFGGAQLQPYLADRALVQTKFEVAQTAAEAVTTLWSYTPKSMDSLADRSQHFLSRDFADQYRKFIDSIVSSNKQAQITNETHVVGAAVESIGPNDATAIVYTNSVATSPLSKGVPSLRYLSYRLGLQRHGSDWLVNRMTALTQLDLTPKL